MTRRPAADLVSPLDTCGHSAGQCPATGWPAPVQLGKVDPGYRMAFQEIDSDPHQLLVVVRNVDDIPVGTMQLTLIASLARGGAKRLQIESVRVTASTRNGRPRHRPP